MIFSFYLESVEIALKLAMLPFREKCFTNRDNDSCLEDCGEIVNDLGKYIPNEDIRDKCEQTDNVGKASSMPQSCAL